MNPLKLIGTSVAAFAVICVVFFGLFFGVINLIEGPSSEYTIDVVDYTTTFDRSMSSNFSYNYPTIVGSIEGQPARITFPEETTGQITGFQIAKTCKVTFEGYYYADRAMGNANKVVSSTPCKVELK
jgi:hypothetical protein